MISNILKQIFLIFLCYNFVSGESCVFKKDTCKCEFSSGRGYDLGGITSAGKFLKTQKVDNITYLLHLCGDTQELPQYLETNNNCSKGYSICQFNEVANMSYVLIAKWEQATMKTTDNAGLVIEYLMNDKSKVATVKLECTPNSKDNVLYKENDSGSDFILYSQQGCITTIEEIHGYGFFQILVIILITVGFSYLFLGILVKYFLVGARGMEIIPNLDFWNKVGRSIRLGWLYVKNGCRIIPSEDSYDAI